VDSDVSPKDACNRLKGGKLPAERLKAQLQKIATRKTGGLKTDELLGKTGAGPEGLPDSIVVTAEGVEGEIAVAGPAAEAPEPAAAKKKARATRTDEAAPAEAEPAAEPKRKTRQGRTTRTKSKRKR